MNQPLYVKEKVRHLGEQRGPEQDSPNRGCLFCLRISLSQSLCTATSEEKPNGGVENDHINLKVVEQDGSVVQFKIKRHTPLSKLMKAFCERQSLSMRQLRFRFDRQPINETDTPAQLEMEDKDTIDGFQQQTGGMASRGTTPHPAIILAFVIEW
ncbi:small ubiquitin-related modifier 3-like [Marmota marmota marmota]|uniref:small ubiquitin-related modifier 3-like n=1 Tax=Marmota marmota marmota TaxID=9994 RepID=UPI0020924D2C|nr:small ubiquitin-related modifier 3-like [Marmota marmota marmota]